MEVDTIRKQTSIRATQMGQQVASKGVTIVDSGIIPNSGGSFRVDDESTHTRLAASLVEEECTPAQRTVRVEAGVLTGYMWDFLIARLTGNRPTGNGRR